jgi:hypothetical protein
LPQPTQQTRQTRNQDEIPPEQLVPIRMKADQYIWRYRAIQSGRPVDSIACTLCSKPEIRQTALSGEFDPTILVGHLLGPFPVADMPDCFFHTECLFTLTGLHVIPTLATRISSHSNLTFGNLDQLVHRALSSGKCFVCKQRGAGIKCCRCRQYCHYPCSRVVNRAKPLQIDPALD